MYRYLNTQDKRASEVNGPSSLLPPPNLIPGGPFSFSRYKCVGVSLFFFFVAAFRFPYVLEACETYILPHTCIRFCGLTHFLWELQENPHSRRNLQAAQRPPCPPTGSDTVRRKTRAGMSSPIDRHFWTSTDRSVRKAARGNLFFELTSHTHCHELFSQQYCSSTPPVPVLILHVLLGARPSVLEINVQQVQKYSSKFPSLFIFI